MVHRTPTCAHTGNSDAGDTMFQFASRFSGTTRGNRDTAAPSFPFARKRAKYGWEKNNIRDF